MRSQGHETGLDGFTELRGRLIGLIGEAERIARELDSSVHAQNLVELRERVESGGFTVLIAGEFNAGKSTTINAILGQDLLPSKITPTTAVLTVIRWGEQKRACLYAYDPQSPTGLAETANGVKIEELRHYITIDNDHREEYNQWGLAQIDWPLPLCRNSVQLVDSPGLNDDTRRNDITNDYLRRADAVVYLLDALALFKMNERELLKLYIDSQGSSHMFFVANKINMVREAEREEVKAFARGILHNDLGATEHRLFFINALGAMDARIGDDSKALAASGLPEFEQELERFLASRRAAIKIVPPATLLRQIAGELIASIEEKTQMLVGGIDRLRENSERARQPMIALEKDRKTIVKTLTYLLDKIREDVEVSARDMLRTAANNYPAWAQGLDRKHHVGMNPIGLQKRSEAAAKEIAEGLEARLRSHVAAWSATERQRIVDEGTKRMEDELDGTLHEFLDRVEMLRQTFSPQLAVTPKGGEPASGLQRTLAGTVGYLVAPGVAMHGARFGFKGMGRAIVPQLGVAIVAGALGFGPLGIFALLVAAGVIQLFVGKDKTESQFTSDVAGVIAQESRNSATDHARKLAAEVHAALEPVQVAVDEALGQQLDRLREDVEAVMRDLSAGTAQAEATRVRLAANEAALSTVVYGSADIIKQFPHEEQ
ncbi:dynamin family protein [Catellatospora sp. NPDC049133]|jgi:GTP-binding protein EngB required for normal cell division|uniref:dynamin family protein n=1 Tax=Catellatospora sp. NPDC049133 TaxID=3155499 RepID=UPI0033F1004C